MKKIFKSSISSLFIVIIFIFILRFGIDVINPTSTNWILSSYSDWGQHYLGWAFFREEPINFPLGKIENYNYPSGTMVGYTDSIPIMAYLCKLFSFLLPEPFQYLGFWLLISHLLTGYFANKIIEIYSTNKLLNLLISLFIAFNPVILYRDMHPALTAHWLIVGSLYFYLIINKNNYDRITKNIIIFNVLAALINPYLSFLTLMISLSSFYKTFMILKKIRKWYAFQCLGITIVLILSFWFLSGMLTLNNDVNMEVSNSYGLYSLNLNSFFNSESLSKFIPALPKVSSFQYEGYSYFGIGGFILVLVAMFLYIINIKVNYNRTLTIVPLLFITFLISLFAISNKITFNDNILFEINIPELLVRIGSIFRATSRFIWLFYYVIFIMSFILILKSNIKKEIKAILILIIFTTQSYDISAFFNKNLPKGEYKLTKLSENRWLKLTSNFERIITYKPFNNHLSNHMDYQDLCLIALKNNKPITIGYVARESTEINKRFTDSLDLQIKDNSFSEENLFIVSKKELPIFKLSIYQNTLQVYKLDDYFVLFPKSKILKQSHYETIAEKQEIRNIMNDIAAEFKYKEIKKPFTYKNKLEFNLEEFNVLENQIQIDGWAFLKDSNHKNDSIFIALIGDNKNYLLQTSFKERPDLASHFKDEALIKAGFICKNLSSKFEPGKYSLMIGVKSLDKFYFENIDGKVINVKKNSDAKKINKLPDFSKEILFNVEKVQKVNQSYLIEGWAGLTNLNSNNNSINIVLIGKENYILDVNYFKRPDVTNNFSSSTKINYDDSGFNAYFKKRNILKGRYSIGILIMDKSKKVYFIDSKKFIEIN